MDFAIGIKQIVPIEKMQFAAELARQDVSEPEFRDALLKSYDGVTVKGGKQLCEENKKNVIAMLARAWQMTSGGDGCLRNRVIALLKDAAPVEAMAVFWGLMGMAYPFWFNVAGQSGRMLKLQNEFTHSQIANRLKETYGDRTTVKCYAQYTLRSFVDWKILSDGIGRGCYRKGDVLRIENARVVSFLYEAVLRTIGGESDAGALGAHPILFPFEFSSITAQEAVLLNDRLECVGVGLTTTRLRV